MPDHKELIIKRLAEEGAKTVTFFRGLQPDDWAQQVYTTGPEWGAYDLLHHFISAERMFAKIYQDIQNGGQGVSKDFDIDAFNAQDVASLRQANHSPEALIAEFDRQRSQTIAIVESFADPDFDRIARHPWFGLTQLENVLKLIYRHTMLHQRDIGKAIETGQPVPHVDAKPPAHSQ
ncbi:MAG TPA: DinB family protein [Anaerolineales bacterium]|nr:DinB family protein [Anaerolineales bacterium]